MKRRNEVTTIEQAYQKFNDIKLSNGMGTLGELNYYDELVRFLKDVELHFDDEISIIDEDMVTQWILSLRGSNLKIASINHYITRLRVFLYWCMRQKLIPEFKINLVKGQEAPLKFIPEEDLKKLMDKPKTDNFSKHRTYTVVCFLLSTGCRASTLINLRVEDVDFKAKKIYYRHSKNRTYHVVPLSNSLRSVLKEYLSTWVIEEYLFPEVTGDQLTVGALRNSLKRYCKRKGIKPYGPHAFRHTMAREWVINGGNVFQLQQLLGHSTLEMTRRYVRLFASDIDINSYNPLDKYTKTCRTLRIERSNYGIQI